MTKSLYTRVPSYSLIGEHKGGLTHHIIFLGVLQHNGIFYGGHLPARDTLRLEYTIFIVKAQRKSVGKGRGRIGGDVEVQIAISTKEKNSFQSSNRKKRKKQGKRIIDDGLNCVADHFTSEEMK